MNNLNGKKQIIDRREQNEIDVTQTPRENTEDFIQQLIQAKVAYAEAATETDRQRLLYREHNRTSFFVKKLRGFVERLSEEQCEAKLNNPHEKTNEFVNNHYFVPDSIPFRRTPFGKTNTNYSSKSAPNKLILFGNNVRAEQETDATSSRSLKRKTKSVSHIMTSETPNNRCARQKYECRKGLQSKFDESEKAVESEEVFKRCCDLEKSIEEMKLEINQAHSMMAKQKFLAQQQQNMKDELRQELQHVMSIECDNLKCYKKVLHEKERLVVCHKRVCDQMRWLRQDRKQSMRRKTEIDLRRQFVSQSA